MKFHVFNSTIQSCQYILKSGKTIAFTAGQYRTADAAEISELEAEISGGHPYLYIDPNNKTADSAVADPLATVKAAAVAEFLAKSGNTGVQTSATVAGNSAESSSKK